jgi:hypothetical protein
MLLVELFQHLNNNLETECFVYFIVKRLETIIKKNNIILIKLRIKWKI